MDIGGHNNMTGSQSAALAAPWKVATLGDLIDLVAEAGDLPARKKAGVLSALRRARELLGQGAADLPANPRIILPRLDRLSPAMAGMGRQSLANLKSRVRWAFRMAAPDLEPARSRVKLVGEWAELEGKLPEGARRTLSRWLRFAQRKGWAPAEVDAPHLERFHTYLTEDIVIERAGNVFRETILAWNRAVDTIPGWPARHLPLPPRKRAPYWIAVDELPESLRREMDAYLDRLTNPDPFLGETPKPLSPATIEQYRLMVIQLASALVGSGVPLQDLTSLHALVTPSHLHRALKFLHARAGDRVNPQIHGLTYRASQVARRLGTLTEAELKALDDIREHVRHATPARRGMTGKNLTLLEHMEDPAFVDRLVTLSRRLMDAAATMTKTDRAASCARDAVAIELLLFCGMRLGNLVGLRVGETIRTYGKGHDAHWVVDIPGEQVKNGQPLRFVLPPESGDLIERYLATWHGHWSGPASPWLFPAAHGGHVDGRYLSSSVAKRARQYVGVEVTCHQFRHLTAELFMRENPDGIGIVSQHLGHRDLNTTRRYYAREQTRIATARYHDVLRRRRESATPPIRIRKSSSTRRSPS